MDGPSQQNQPTTPAGGQTGNNQPAPNSGGKGYGKRPMWQWIALYVVVGAVVYFLIYLIFFSGGDSGSGNSLY